MSRTAALATLLVLLAGCIAAREPIEDIRREQYPGPRATAEDVFAFFRRAVRADDPEAAYFCLGASIQNQISFGQFVDGWTLFGESFALFAGAEVTSARDEAEGRVLTISLVGVDDDFLWSHEPEKGYRLVLPSRYNRRSLEDLLAEVKGRGAPLLKPRERPERRGG